MCSHIQNSKEVLKFYESKAFEQINNVYHKAVNLPIFIHFNNIENFIDICQKENSLALFKVNKTARFSSFMILLYIFFFFRLASLMINSLPSHICFLFCFALLYWRLELTAYTVKELARIWNLGS